MPATLRIAIKEQTQVAEARRVARKLASDIGLEEDGREQVAIVVTEACTNILKYAEGGEILVSAPGSNSGDNQTILEVVAIDRGPGMRNLARCLQDGFTTGDFPGNGMGTIVRLSCESDFYSEHGKGAALVARWSAGGSQTSDPLKIGAVNVPKAGQEVCGDSWGVVREGPSFTLMVADGLGHGYDAQTASLAAVQILREHPGLPLKELLDYAHGALRSTRGAAVSVARVDLSLGVVKFAGIGNVAAQICSGSKHAQHLVSVNGTVGHHSQQIREFTYPWPANGILILHSDGLSSGTGFAAYPGLVQRDPALMAGVLYRDFSRGNDDATVVVARAV